jgi:hypothetical protein
VCTESRPRMRGTEGRYDGGIGATPHAQIKATGAARSSRVACVFPSPPFYIIQSSCFFLSSSRYPLHSQHSHNVRRHRWKGTSSSTHAAEYNVWYITVDCKLTLLSIDHYLQGTLKPPLSTYSNSVSSLGFSFSPTPRFALGLGVRIRTSEAGIAHIGTDTGGEQGGGIKAGIR